MSMGWASRRSVNGPIWTPVEGTLTVNVITSPRTWPE
jgi:hypothetical protein